MKDEPQTIDEIAKDMGVDLGPEMVPNAINQSVEGAYQRQQLLQRLRSIVTEGELDAHRIHDELTVNVPEENLDGVRKAFAGMKEETAAHRTSSARSNTGHLLAVMSAMAATTPGAAELLEEAMWERGRALRPPRTETDINGFHPDRPKPKKPGFRPKKLRKKR